MKRNWVTRKHLLCTVEGPVHDERLMQNALLDACHAANAQVKGKVEHSFYPQGFTTAVILGESHATIHTWPKEKIALIDYFSCAHDPFIDDFIFELQNHGLTIIDTRIIERKIPA